MSAMADPVRFGKIAAGRGRARSRHLRTLGELACLHEDAADLGEVLALGRVPRGR